MSFEQQGTPGRRSVALRRERIALFERNLNLCDRKPAKGHQANHPGQLLIRMENWERLLGTATRLPKSLSGTLGSNHGLEAVDAPEAYSRRHPSLAWK